MMLRATEPWTYDSDLAYLKQCAVFWDKSEKKNTSANSNVKPSNVKLGKPTTSPKFDLNKLEVMVDSAVDKDAQEKSSFLLDNGATASAVISTCFLTCLEVCEGQVKTASGDFSSITSKGLFNLRHIG